jgi:hypothetical protein
MAALHFQQGSLVGNAPWLMGAVSGTDCFSQGTTLSGGKGCGSPSGTVCVGVFAPAGTAMQHSTMHADSTAATAPAPPRLFPNAPVPIPCVMVDIPGTMFLISANFFGISYHRMNKARTGFIYVVDKTVHLVVKTGVCMMVAAYS